MQPAELFFSELRGEDARWIFSHLEERLVEPGETIIRAGDLNASVMFILDGHVRVYQESAQGDDEEFVKLGPGEIIGDLSWLDGEPASVSVAPIESTLIGFLDRRELDEHLASDPLFRSAFFRALARVLAARVRRLTTHVLRQSVGWQSLAGIEPAIHLKSLLDTLSAHKAGPEIEPAFAALLDGLNFFEVAPPPNTPPGARSSLFALMHRELRPLVLTIGTASRLLRKPRGFPFDHVTIDGIVNRAAFGSDPSGVRLDRCFLNRPGMESIRARRRLMTEQIGSLIAGRPDARIAGVGVGAAHEAVEAMALRPDRPSVEFSAIDSDPEALAALVDAVARRSIRQRVWTVQGNVGFMVCGRELISIRDSDLIYGTSLLDHASDVMAVRVLDWTHDQLRPGGLASFAIVSCDNPDRAFLSHVLDCPTFRRNEDQLNALFQRSKFGRSCSRFLRDDAETCLIAECVRA